MAKMRRDLISNSFAPYTEPLRININTYGGLFKTLLNFDNP